MAKKKPTPITAEMITELLTPDNLRAWLKLNSKERFLPCSSCGCVIAKFLFKTLSARLLNIRVTVGGGTCKIIPPGQPTFNLFMPEWVRMFIDTFDVNNLNEVGVREALFALDQTEKELNKPPVPFSF